MGRGAAGAERVGFGEEVSPYPTGVGLGRGLCPEIFLTFWLKIVHFGIYSDKNSQFSVE